jgi:nicotinamide-nucleotide amidase
MSTATVRELKTLCLSQQPALRLAVAESLTGGRVQAAITAVSGASEFFLGGVTAYSIDQKVKVLGVKRAAATSVNGVSAEVAAQMAQGAVRLFGADIAVATTGYAERATLHHVDEAFAYWAIAHRLSARRWRILSGRVVCPELNRTEVQDVVTEAVLSEWVAYLKTVKTSPPHSKSLT